MSGETCGSARFASGGTRILTTSWDGFARVWDAASGELIHVLKHAGGILHARGALAAFAYGRAAAAIGEMHLRGFTLDEVLAKLPFAWSSARVVPRPPVMVELPGLSSR